MSAYHREVVVELDGLFLTQASYYIRSQQHQGVAEQIGLRTLDESVFYLDEAGPGETKFDAIHLNTEGDIGQVCMHVPSVKLPLCFGEREIELSCHFKWLIDLQHVERLIAVLQLLRDDLKRPKLADVIPESGA